MFGLENKNNDSKLFDLENDLKGENGQEKIVKLKKLVKDRQEAIKLAMREGESRENFEKSEVLLNGYNALHQVIDRIKK
jgi:hypothetical protein